MRALITNDDGFESEGLRSLKDFVLSIGFRDIIVVAPKTNKTASSHAVSINKRLRIEEVAENTFSVDGTPADCVITAFHDPRCMKSGTPDIVFSGVNIGANLGIDTIHSGTVAAAMQGLLSGVPSFALSQFYTSDPRDIVWNIDSSYIRDYILASLKHKDIFKNCILNINLPACKVVGIRNVSQYRNEDDHTRRVSAIETSLHDDGNEKYITIETTGSPQFCKFLHSGYATVTPVGCDLTDYAALKLLDMGSDS